MTVENTTSRQVAQQMGTLYTYPFTFTVLLTDPTEDEALKAIKAKVKQADGSEIDLVYGSEGADGYTVTLNTNRNGGTVTVIDKRTAADYITIYREYEETQEADYQDFNAAPAETYEQCFDKLTMLCQQQQEKIDRCIKVDMTSDITPEVFVDQVVRIYDSIDNVDTVANNSADVSTVADNITDVNTCADSISNINATGSNINNVNICAQNINDINTCADDIAAIKDAPAQAQAAANSAQSAASSETAAASSQQAAYLSQIAAADSERYAEIWAEGTDDEVQSIGGIHSSKVWSELSAGGGANKDLSNLTELGEKHFLNKSQITNCILEIPQKIKIEHDSATATLTLKAGSILIVPYGLEDLSTTITVGSTFIHENFIVSDTRYNAGKFFVWVEVQNDISYSEESVDTERIRLVEISLTANNLIHMFNTDATNQDEEINNCIRYITNLNIIKHRNATGQDTGEVISFPFCQVKSNGSHIAGYIANVFQGIGHIGNVSWCDKDIKVLFGNGRDKDGNFINIEHTKNQISLTNLNSSYSDKPYYLSITPDTSEEDGTLFQASLDSYIVSETQPTVSDSTSIQRWYNPSENKFYIFTQELNWVEDPQVWVGLVFYANDEMAYFEQFYPYGATGGNNLRTVTTYPSFYRGLKIFGDTGTYATIWAQNYSADYSSESGVFYGGRFISIDKDRQWFGALQSLQNSSGTRYTELLARRILDGENKQASMGVYINAAGDMYAQAPTYTGNYADNSSKIVTTAYMANHWVTAKPTTTSTASKARPAVVVQNYLNGSSWYRVWSDGFIEQGGLVGASNPEDTTYTITFLKKFTNTNYGFWWSANLVEDSYTYYLRFDIGCYQNKTASNIKINVRRGYNNAIWRACGY